MSALSHVTFAVADADRAAAVFERVLNGRVVHRGDGTERSREVFVLVDDVWVALVESEPPATQTYDHVAFRVSAAELAEREARVRAMGLEVVPSRTRGAGDGRSLYFRDHDRHLIELHAGTLEARLEALGAAR